MAAHYVRRTTCRESWTIWHETREKKVRRNSSRSCEHANYVCAVFSACFSTAQTEEHEIDAEERNYGFVSIKCSLSLETGWSVKCTRRFSLNIQMQISNARPALSAILFHSKYSQRPLRYTLCVDRMVTIAFAIWPLRSAATLSISCGSSMRRAGTETRCINLQHFNHGKHIHYFIVRYQCVLSVDSLVLWLSCSENFISILMLFIRQPTAYAAHAVNPFLRRLKSRISISQPTILLI